MKDYLETKHIIKMKMNIYGRVDQSDIIGAIFGQTEDVLGDALDLRELQRKNKIGRIEVGLETQKDKVVATVTIPSALDKTESAIIAAALETIKKIGPCLADARVESIEDIKRIKMREIIDKAKEVLQKFMSLSVDSQEIIEKVVGEVRKSQAREYGKDKLLAGPRVEKDDEVILVETKEELLNLLTQGIKNCIAVENKFDSETLKELADKKVITALINKGREFVVRKIIETADIDYVAKPEFGTSVKDMQSKEIYKSIRSRVVTSQVVQKAPKAEVQMTKEQRPVPRPAPVQQTSQSHDNYSHSVKGFEILKKKFEELKGKQDAVIIDNNLDVLGQVPVADLAKTIPSLNRKIYAIVINGKIPKEVVQKSEYAGVGCLVGSSTEKTSTKTKIIILK